MVDIGGSVETGWGKVADAFRANFDEGKEQGAAVAVYRGGTKVVDLWGGVADATTGRAWEEDSVVMAFSSTKGMTAVLAHLLVQRGELDLDAPVATYWPEFAANGKEAIPVRWLLTHQAGLPYVDADLTIDEILAWDPLVAALAAQKPLWEPGQQHAYHALTYGHLVGEVLRRVSGKSVGRLFADEVAGPLGLSTWIGLPADQEPRVARLAPTPKLENEALQQLLDTFLGAGSVFDQSVLAFPVELITADGVGDMGTREVRAAEIPAGNMVTDARSLARAYAATVSEVDGIRLLTPATVETARTVQTEGSEPWGMPPGLEDFGMTFGLGFQVTTPLADLLGPTSFGHGGAGGSMGLGEVDHEIGFGYVMNQMLTEIPNRPRNQLIMDAVVASLG